MLKRVRKCWSTLDVSIILMVMVTVLYNEYLCYIIAAFSWFDIQNVKEYSQNGDEQLRMLFVADPQIVGNGDVYTRFGVFARLDCDRYLKNTFTRAFKHVQPDVVIFLGDELDEGSTTTNEEYEIYFQRFSAVFETSPSTQMIYIPGDNDVGGEGSDKKVEYKVNRFIDHFRLRKEHDHDHLSIKFVNFVETSIDFDQMLNPEFLKGLAKVRSASGNKFRIILNHMEVIGRSDIHKILKTVQPSFVFTAHTHKARLSTCHDCDKESPKRLTQHSMSSHHLERNKLTVGGSAVYRFDLKNNSTLNEISVPTCSYRMGVPEMGYGAAVLDKFGNMKYSVLWLPSRYWCLYIYVYMSIFAIGVLLYERTCIYFKQLHWHCQNKPRTSTGRYNNTLRVM